MAGNGVRFVWAGMVCFVTAAQAQVVVQPGAPYNGPAATLNGSVSVRGYNGNIAADATLSSTGVAPFTAAVHDLHAGSQSLGGGSSPSASGRVEASAASKVSLTEVGVSFSLLAQADATVGYTAFYAPGGTATASADLNLPVFFGAAGMAAGTPGFARMRFAVTGTLNTVASGVQGNAAPGYGEGFSRVQIDVGTGALGRDAACGAVYDFCAYRPLNNGGASTGQGVPASFSVEYAFTAGQATMVFVQLVADGAATANARGAASQPGAATAEFGADFFHTVRVAQVEGVFDAQRHPLSAWTAISLPGVSLVPEPAPWALALAGMLGLGAAAGRRRVTASA